MRIEPATLKAPNLDRLDEYEIVSVDCETTGLHWYSDRAFGVAIAAATDTGEIRSGYWDTRESPRIIQILKDKLPKCRRIVNHNIKFDALFLGNEGIHFEEGECTSVRAALINEHEVSFQLGNLCEKHIGQGKQTGVYQELADLFGGKATAEAQMKNLHRAPKDVAARYATMDPVLAILLWKWQEEEIARQNLHQIWALEKRVTGVLIDMERRGVNVDVERASEASAHIDKELMVAQQALNKLAGADFNANSPKQMRELFKVHKDGKTWRTDTGHALLETEAKNPSIDADALRAIEEKDPRAKAIMRLRKLSKAKQFLDGHILGHHRGGVVFPNYNQTRGENELGTGTGRFSINDPALQQIPARDKDIASIVRACFVPPEGYDWCCADWEQFEFRWFAHYVNSPKINEIYRRDPNADFHKTVAILTGLPRSARYAGDANAKQINLGMVFGMGEGKMAAEMGMPHTVEERNDKEWLVAGEEAKATFAQYHEAIPGVKELLGKASSIARSRGYVQTIAGRHIRFPGGKFTHKAAGLVFQGSSADCMKQKMVELHESSKGQDWSLRLSVHDECDFYFPKGESERLTAHVKEVLECFDGERSPIKCRVPILSSVTCASNWWEASK